MTIGKRLKSVREERGLSQTEVAKLSKMCPQDISKYENGGSIPSVNRLKTIAKVLQTSTDYLIFGGEKKEEIEFANPKLKESFLSANSIGKKDQETIIRVVEAMVVKNTVKSATKDVE